jgi:hypothetical protein
MIASGPIKGRMLKIAFGELVGAANGLEAAATICRVGKSTLARYASLSPDDAACFAPVDVVRDLEELTGQAIVTRKLAQLAALALFELPDALPDVGDLLVISARLAKEHGEVAAAIINSLEDRKVTKSEARECRSEVADAIRLLVTLDATLAQIEAEGDQ